MDFVTESNGRDCKHGNLARKCLICKMEQEIATLTASLRQAEADLESARFAREHWVMEYGAEKERRQQAVRERDEALESARAANGKREWAEREIATERAARESAEQLAVWAVREDARIVGRYLWQLKAGYIECDSTDAGILAALRRAMEESSDGES